MSTAKIPVVILVSWAFKQCITPPNPPPPKSEVIPSTVMEGTWYTQIILRNAARVQYIAAFLEIVTILADRNPQLPVSKAILSNFIFQGGSPGSIQLTTPTSIGAAMLVLGTLLRLMTYRYLGRFFLFEPSVQENHELITKGPYSFVRHPSYTGLLITHPGWFLWQLSRGSWVRESGLWNTVMGKLMVCGYAVLVILVMLSLLFKRMAGEDAALKKKFGEKWEEWAKEVPYSLFPGIY